MPKNKHFFPQEIAIKICDYYADNLAMLFWCEFNLWVYFKVIEKYRVCKDLFGGAKHLSILGVYSIPRKYLLKIHYFYVT